MQRVIPPWTARRRIVEALRADFTAGAAAAQAGVAVAEAGAAMQAASGEALGNADETAGARSLG
jgi:hypothetical protein